MSLHEEGLDKLESSAVDASFLCFLQHRAVGDRVKYFLDVDHYDDARVAGRPGSIEDLMVK